VCVYACVCVCVEKNMFNVCVLVIGLHVEPFQSVHVSPL
jgi:hypothetical protein